MSEKVTSPLGSFLTMSERILAFISAFPSISTSAFVLALITMSRSEPITSMKPSVVLKYIPCSAGAAGRGSTILETVDITFFNSSVFILNFNLLLYIFNNNKAVGHVESFLYRRKALVFVV